MAKTIGQLRAEGKSFRQISSIGRTQLNSTSKGRSALKRLNSSSSSRSSSSRGQFGTSHTRTIKSYVSRTPINRSSSRSSAREYSVNGVWTTKNPNIVNSKPLIKSVNLINKQKQSSLRQNGIKAKNKINSLANRNTISNLFRNRIQRSKNSRKFTSTFSSPVNSSLFSNKKLGILYPSKKLSEMSFSERADYYSNRNKKKTYDSNYFKSVAYTPLGILEDSFKVLKNAPKSILKTLGRGSPTYQLNKLKQLQKNKKLSTKSFYSDNPKLPTKEQISLTGASLGKAFKTQDPRFVATILAPKVPTIILKGASSTYKFSKFAGKKEIKSTSLLDKQAVQEGKFPTSKTTKAQNQKLKKSFNEVVTLSPKKFKKNTIVDHSKKSKLGLEDAGVYVAPKGSGNPYFARVNQVKEGGYSLNPKKIFSSIYDDFQIPAVTKFKTKGSVTPAKDVLKSKGFSKVNKWNTKHVSGTGKISTTKRSAVGRNEIKSKSKKDKGTTEIEYVIPKGSKFKVRDTRQYIKINGRKVLVQKGQLDIIKKFKESKSSKFFLDKSKSSKKYKSPYKYGLSSYSKSSSSHKKGSSYSKTNKYSSEGLLGYKKGTGISSGGNSSGNGGSSTGGSSSGSSSASKGSSTGGSSSGYGSYVSTFSDSKKKKKSFPKLKSKKKKKSNLKGYNIFVKKRGKSIQLNTQPLKFNTALSRTKSLVDNTLLRSAKITGSKIPKGLKSKKFTFKNSKSSILIKEKSKYKLDSKREKQQFQRTKRYSKK